MKKAKRALRGQATSAAGVYLRRWTGWHEAMSKLLDCEDPGWLEKHNLELPNKTLHDFESEFKTPVTPPTQPRKKPGKPPAGRGRANRKLGFNKPANNLDEFIDQVCFPDSTGRVNPKTRAMVKKALEASEAKGAEPVAPFMD